ncbi:MAG: glycosyltransferase family 39 protein, partial [Nitrospirales bacterium]
MINSFPDDYDKLASNILAGNGYRIFPDTSETLLRTPGYPLFLTLIFYFFPNSLVAVKIVNLTLGLLTAWIVALLTWRLTAHKATATLAAFLFLIHPAILFAQSRSGPESLFTLLITGFVLALCQAFDRKKMLDFVVAGILLGMATIVKSTTIFFPAFLFGLVLLKKQWQS